MRRATSRVFQSLLLAAGAPLGWLLIRGIGGTPVRKAVADEPDLFAYLFLGTATAFGLFGLMLGNREERMLEAIRRLEDLTITDPLTGLRNTRYFHSRLAEEHAEAERTGRPLSVVVLDLDHFKRINDQHGHLVGDEVLANTAHAIASITRQGETGARIGGEEFALLLPDSTAEEAMEVAERVRRAIAEGETPLPEPQRGTLKITASAGVVCTTDLPDATTEELLRAADEAMYRAKRLGRNRTVVARMAA